MGFFSNLLREKKPQKPFAKLLVDVHSHLLPGIDDGAKSMEESLLMIRMLIDMGYQKLIITPHVMAHMYPNTSQKILQVYNSLQTEVIKQKLPILLEISAEYYLDDTLFERIKNNDLLPFAGNHILFECSFRNEPLSLFDLVFQLKAAGYQPVIAHFERYVYFHNRIEIAQELQSLGCLIQVNLLSFSGYYGKSIQRQAAILYSNNCIDLVGTDCHKIAHLENLTDIKKVKKLSKYIDYQVINQSLL